MGPRYRFNIISISILYSFVSFFRGSAFLTGVYVENSLQNRFCCSLRKTNLRRTRERVWYGEALIWTLKDSFPTKCTDYVAETWRELYNCYYDERTEESKHWHVRLKTERPCGLGMSWGENWDFTGDDLKRTPS